MRRKYPAMIGTGFVTVFLIALTGCGSSQSEPALPATMTATYSPAATTTSPTTTSSTSSTSPTTTTSSTKTTSKKPTKSAKATATKTPKKTSRTPVIPPRPAKTTTKAAAETVHGGSFCPTAGATGVTTTGKHMTCKTSDTDNRLRWRS